jgi:hypothetical protein
MLRILVWDDEVTCGGWVIKRPQRPVAGRYGVAIRAEALLPGQSQFLDAAYILGRTRDLVDRKIEFAGPAGQVLGER